MRALAFFGAEHHGQDGREGDRRDDAQHQLAAITKDMFWVGIDKKNNDGVMEKGADGQPAPWYSLGKETKTLHSSSLDLAEVLASLEKTLADTSGEVRLRIRADSTPS